MKKRINRIVFEFFINNLIVNNYLMKGERILFIRNLPYKISS